ncbi:MAG TPA: 30S ribosomal protein S16 [Candidatus Portnoybacteria bacterium]|nr:30S ribosomal protein S16 [Candidatus Portnoybacteria bacterium]
MTEYSHLSFLISHFSFLKHCNVDNPRKIVYIFNIMLSIRFQRVGKKHQPMYRIVVANKTQQPQGKVIEILGNYNPFSKVAQIKKERVLYWLSVGAQPTAVTHNLLIKNQIIKGAKMRADKRKPVEEKPVENKETKAETSTTSAENNNEIEH